jgi:fructose/tagatose bisphosphate aldolase
MTYQSLEELQEEVSKVFSDGLISDETQLRDVVIDNLVYTAVLSEDETLKKEARRQVRMIAKAFGAISTSIHNVYLAVGSGTIPRDFSVPAINVRFMTYDTAQIIFRLIQQHNVGAVIFEIARSEIEYTAQRPDEYAVSVLGAAVKAGYKGPVFIQGDHYQFSANRFKESEETETNKIKDLIKESLDADFNNIDIDASTLVDLSKPTQDEQQETNYRVTVELTEYIRSIQGDHHISIGAEIGHIGGKNSTPEELSAFVDGYRKKIPDVNTGISKISVQTGSSHGGVVLPDGTIASVEIDFNVISKCGDTAHDTYKLGGVVQHGASTLPDELFHKFPENRTLEVHLATGFQNIVFDTMPESLNNEMSVWTLKNCAEDKERDPKWNDKQFVYKLRKKSIGPFKKQCWMLTEDEKRPIIEGLEKQLTFLFEQLNVVDTKDKILPHVQ